MLIIILLYYMSLPRQTYKNRVEDILPTHQKRHQRYFNAFVKKIGLSKYTYPKEEVVSFLRSIIRINMYSCIDPNNRINRRNCNEDIKNINNLGTKIKINGMNLIDCFTKIINDEDYKVTDDKYGYYVIQYKNNYNQTVLQNDKYKNFIDLLNNYNIPTDVYQYLILEIDLNQPTQTTQTKAPSSSKKSSRKSTRRSSRKSSRKSTRSLLMRISEGEDESNSIVSNNSESIDFTKLNKLKTICSNSNICIAFGREMDDIIHFFNLKKNFKYATNVRTVSNGVNGIVDVINYERESYQTNAILKRINVHSDDKSLDRLDNLIYEYFVGHFFINEIKKKLPIFIETYGYIEDIRLKYNIITTQMGPDEYNKIKWKKITKKTLEDLKIKNISYREINDALSFACNTPSKVGLLTEYLHDSKTLQWYVSPSNRDYINFWIYELINVLFQIYYCLVAIKDKFTHYDLHAANVLIYKPIDGKYIEYIYHYEGKVISFQSQYIVKIIDYGRCYFNSSDIDSSKIYTMVCNNPQCNFDKKCGKSKGFTWLVDPTQPNSQNSYMNSSRKNESHDLRLIYYINTILRSMHDGGQYIFNRLPKYIRRPFFNLFQNVQFETRYGTREILQGNDKDKIYNINEALEYIVDLIDDLPKINYHSLGYSKIGDLNVYGDRDIVFNPI